MKLKASFVALAFAAGISASIALAGPPPGHGRDGDTSSSVSSTGSSLPAPAPAARCRPEVSMILKGLYVGAGADGSSFVMDVKQANRHGGSMVGQQLSVAVDAKTKFRRNGPAKLSDFVAGDRLNVQVRACKPQEHGRNAAPPPAGAPAPALLAKRVVGQPAQASSGSDDGDGSTQSTSTETQTSPSP